MPLVAAHLGLAVVSSHFLMSSAELAAPTPLVRLASKDTCRAQALSDLGEGQTLSPKSHSY